MKWISQHRVLLAATVCAVLLGGVSLASGSGFVWEDWFDLDETIDMGVEIQQTTNGPLTRVGVERGPLVGGSYQVLAIAQTEATDQDEGTLLGMRLLVADDLNANGRIETSEWELKDSALGVLETGWTVARGTHVSIPATKDAYCIEFDWREPGGYEWTSAEIVTLSDITELDSSAWWLGDSP